MAFVMVMIGDRAQHMRVVSALLALIAAGCGDSAMAICKKLQSDGVAENCRAASVPPDPPFADASARVTFDMTSGGSGQVLSFASEVIFSAVSEVAPHPMNEKGISLRQGYVKKRAMILLSESATAADERAARQALGQKP
jgi:hypothetical protein